MQTFQRVATYFKGVVEFMEVECSKNEETTAFCSKSNVRAYPTLILFTGIDIDLFIVSIVFIDLTCCYC
jgi:hypothetical protein